jgi:hypothetical protein
VRERIETLLETLIAIANGEQTIPEQFGEAVTIQWLPSPPKPPTLGVVAPPNAITELVFERRGYGVKKLLRNDLSVLRDRIGILEEEFPNTQITALWKFKIRLWFRSALLNVRALRREWVYYKWCASANLLMQRPFAPPRWHDRFLARTPELRSDWLTNRRRPYHNLPDLYPRVLMGHESDLSKLLQWLQPYRSPYRMGVVGSGGVGKTHLVLALAQRCLQASHSNAGHNFDPNGQWVNGQWVQSDGAESIDNPVLFWTLSRTSPPAHPGDESNERFPYNFDDDDEDRDNDADDDNTSDDSEPQSEPQSEHANLDTLEAEIFGSLWPDRPITIESSQLPIPTFDQIIWLKAPSQSPVRSQLEPFVSQDFQFHTLFRTLAGVLNRPDLLLGSFRDRVANLHRCLCQFQTLLIVDRADQFPDLPDLLGFLTDLPTTVKVLTTSRVPLWPHHNLTIHPLGELEAWDLMEYEFRLKRIQLRFPEMRQVYQTTQGHPQAILFALGQLAVGYPLARVPLALVDPPDGSADKSTDGSADLGIDGLATDLPGAPDSPDGPGVDRDGPNLCHIYLEQSMGLLQGHGLAHQLFMALALFAKAPLDAAVEWVVVPAYPPGELDCDEAWDFLEKLALIKRYRRRCYFAPFCRQYAEIELSSQADSLTYLREHWLEWAAYMAEAGGQVPWGQMAAYVPLEQDWENVAAAIEWCIQTQRYADFSQIWPRVKPFVTTYGYWQSYWVWTQWWLEMAGQREDLENQIQAWRDQAWLWILLRNTQRPHPPELTQAQTLLTQAWQMLLTWQPLNPADPNGPIYPEARTRLELQLAIDQGIVALFSRQFPQAETWFQWATDLLEMAHSSQVDPAYEAQIFYYWAALERTTQHYDRAKTLYWQALKKCQVLGWHLGHFHCWQGLAWIAVVQRDLDLVEILQQDPPEIGILTPNLQRYPLLMGDH